MTAQLPTWPTAPPACGSVVLRAFTDKDAHLAVEVGEDPYIPLIGSLPAHPTAEQALDWIRRQRGQLAEGQRFSFAIADAESDKAVGAIGLGLRELSAGRATAGYAVSPLHRGCGIATSALMALTAFAWTIPALYRVELYIEPWNTSSIHVAQASGYQREGLLRSHQEIGGVRCDMLLYATARPSARARGRTAQDGSARSIVEVVARSWGRVYGGRRRRRPGRRAARTSSRPQLRAVNSASGHQRAGCRQPV